MCTIVLKELIIILEIQVSLTKSVFRNILDELLKESLKKITFVIKISEKKYPKKEKGTLPIPIPATNTDDLSCRISYAYRIN